MMIFGLCLSRIEVICSDDVPSAIDLDTIAEDSGLEHVDREIGDNVESDDQRKSRFVIFGGDDVPEYDDVDVSYDYDDIDLDDDDDHHDADDPGDHHIWWHHFYHHGEPHLPFPLFPPIFVHPHRHVYRSCKEWPFTCTNSYEVFRWLQCYYEFLGKTGVAGPHYADGGGVQLPVIPVAHAWKK